MKTKYDIINFLGKKYNYSTYLEISSVATGYDYDKIDNEIFKIKDILLYYPIDDFTYDWKNINVRNDINFGPDEFEKGLNKLEGKKYDIIFVDPWHTFEQSKRDISVAINLVSDNGIIVIHDCSPEHFSLTGQYSMGGWCGQTYEAFIDFNINHPNIDTCVVDIDYGCGIIRKDKFRKKPYKLPDNMELKDVAEWEYFNSKRKELLNLIDVENFKENYLINSKSTLSILLRYRRSF